MFLFCICLAQRSTTLHWPVFLAGGRCQALLWRELQYLQTITVGTRRNQRRRDPSRGNKKIKICEERNSHRKINNILLDYISSSLKVLPWQWLLFSLPLSTFKLHSLNKSKHKISPRDKFSNAFLMPVKQISACFAVLARLKDQRDLCLSCR